MCGSNNMTRRRVTIEFPKGLTHSVMADVCGHCGEQYFDRAAMQELEAADPRYRESRIHRRRSS